MQVLQNGVQNYKWIYYIELSELNSRKVEADEQVLQMVFRIYNQLTNQQTRSRLKDKLWRSEFTSSLKLENNRGRQAVLETVFRI